MPASQESKYRLKLWKHWLLALCSVCLLCLLVFQLLSSITPEQHAFQPDSHEAWRYLLQEGDHPEKLAALILLASEGDESATESFIELMPSFTNEELKIALYVFAAIAYKQQIQPSLVESLLSWKYEKSQSHTKLLLNVISEVIESGSESEYAKYWTYDYQDKISKEKSISSRQYKELRTPWIFRRNNTTKALIEINDLHIAFSKYRIWNGILPTKLSTITTPVAYTKTVSSDICAVSGPYSYAQIYPDYLISSTGPDGKYDLSPKHFLLTRSLTGKNPGIGGKTPYVHWAGSHYEFLDNFVPGADILQLYDESIYDEPPFK